MPLEIQQSIFVIYSFFAELDGLAVKVSEPMLGEIRCQWWYDIITNKTPESPLAEALIEAMDKHAWPEKPLLDMINAKIFDLYANPMDNKAGFEAYAGHTYSTLVHLSANAIDTHAAKVFSDVSGHLGVAFCVAKCLTYLKIHQSRGQVYIPTEILSKAGFDADHFLASTDVTKINTCLQDFANYGLYHYGHARQALNMLDKPTKQRLFPAILPMLRSKLILQNAVKHGDNISQKLETILPRQLNFQWQLIKANLFKIV